MVHSYFTCAYRVVACRVGACGTSSPRLLVQQLLWASTAFLWRCMTTPMHLQLMGPRSGRCDICVACWRSSKPSRRPHRGCSRGQLMIVPLIPLALMRCCKYCVRDYCCSFVFQFWCVSRLHKAAAQAQQNKMPDSPLLNAARMADALVDKSAAVLGASRCALIVGDTRMTTTACAHPHLCRRAIPVYPDLCPDSSTDVYERVHDSACSHGIIQAMVRCSCQTGVPGCVALLNTAAQLRPAPSHWCTTLLQCWGPVCRCGARYVLSFSQLDAGGGTAATGLAVEV